MRYKGWDWAEVLKALGVHIKEVDDSVLRADMERRCLAAMRRLGNGGVVTAEDRKLASAVREFLRALERRGGQEAPLWRGLRKVEDDFTLLSWWKDMFPGAWS